LLVNILVENHKKQKMFLCQTHCVFFLPSLGSTSNADQKKPPEGG